MAVSIVFHNNSGVVALKMVIDNDDICTQVLGINNLLCEFAIASLYQQHILCVGLFSFH